MTASSFRFAWIAQFTWGVVVLGVPAAHAQACAPAAMSDLEDDAEADTSMPVDDNHREGPPNGTAAAADPLLYDAAADSFQADARWAMDVTDWAYGPENINFFAAGFRLDDPGYLHLSSCSYDPANYHGAEFGNDGDFSFLYALDGDNDLLVRIDVATGEVSEIGPAAPFGLEIWSGLAMDHTTGTMFASSSECEDTLASSLYTIDLDTGATTRIGAVTNSPCLIAIAVDASGQMYGHDVLNDHLLSIDKASGTGTLIGPLGFDALYTQGMDFDDSDGTLYLAAFNDTESRAELRVADTTTGHTTYVGRFGLGLGLLSIGGLGIRPCPPGSCGDGALGCDEDCDDGNNEDGDGCSALCEMEGACCEDGQCLETVVESACGGGWVRGQNCSEFQCPGWSIYWLDAHFLISNIRRSDLSGVYVDEVLHGMQFAYTLDLDPIHGKMYWWDTATDWIHRADLDGGNVEQILHVEDWGDTALDLQAGKMYWTDWGSGHIRRANLDGSDVEDVLTLGAPYGIDVDPQGGKVYWVNIGSTWILSANLDGTNVEILVSYLDGLSNPTRLVVDPMNQKLYWFSDSDEGRKIYRCDLDGENIEDVVSVTYAEWAQITIDHASGLLYWTEPRKIGRVDLDGNNAADVTPCGLTIKPRGLAIIPPCGNHGLDGDEQCDDGNHVNGDGCDENCILEVCGNGVLQVGEECDDGNNDNDDGCDENCLSECANSSDCADDDGDSVRDDNCLWWECAPGECLATAIIFADMGRDNGGCTPDGTADANDRFHALNCFSTTSTLGTPGYPCEDNPPSAYNVDAGGPFGECCPDGVCDGNDAFHALNAFEGDNPCACPANFACPCPTPTEPPDNPVLCPPGPMPGAAGGGTRNVEQATVVLEASSRAVRPGQVIEVDAHLVDGLLDLRGYQLHVAAQGGRRGSLELVDIVIEDRKDRAFAGLADWQAFNVSTQQVLAGLDTAGIDTRPGSYLATFVFEASHDAAGNFTVELLHDDTDPSQRTFLFPTAPGHRIQILEAAPAVVTVAAPPTRRGRS